MLFASTEIQAILGGPFAYRQDLEHVLGVWMWGAVLHRALLSLPHAVYRQLNAESGTRFVLWSSTRRELVAMQRVIPMVVFRAGAPFGPGLFATDARGPRNGDAGAFGIGFTPASPAEVEEVCALGRSLSYTVACVSDFTATLNRPERFTERTVPRSRLSRGLADQTRWIELEHGTWRYGDHINLGELRAVSRLTNRLAGLPFWFGRTILSLQDNSTCAGAFTKRRSPSVPVNRLCRQLGPCTLR